MVKENDGFIVIKEPTSRPMFKCVTCDNNITEFRAMKFPICDECMKDLREIIKEKRNAKR